MKITLYFSTNAREQEIGRAIVAGCQKHGVRVDARLRADFWTGSVDKEAEIIGFVGVKSRAMWKAATEAGKTTLLIDKGYFGRGEFYRMSLGAYQPPYLASMDYDTTRLNSMGVTLHNRQEGRGTCVMYVGSSQKYCNFHGLGDNNDYARKVIMELHQHWRGSEHSVIYRPKPSWWAKHKAGERRDNLKDLGVDFSTPDKLFAKELARCQVVVTHGSNGAVEALAYGVPVILLSEVGISPVHHLCSHWMHEMNNPYWPSADERLKTLSNLAWCQYTVKEISAGFAWGVIGRAWGGIERWVRL
jgi:hypothetical protein